MKAAVVTRFGGPEVIELVELPTPQPGPGQVLIKVLAARVNRLDHHIRQGDVASGIPLPHILGMDAVGEIAELGAGVPRLALGDRVIAMPGYPSSPDEQDVRPVTRASSYTLLGLHRPGTYAQYMVAPEKWVIADTSGLPPEQAVALPTPLLTAIRAVETVGEVKAGDRVLVHAGASGTGCMAIQVAKVLGARVAATVRCAAAARVAAQVGADRVIDTSDEDVIDAIRRWTRGRGVDVAIDCLGGPDFARMVEAVRPLGIVVLDGLMAGATVTLDLKRIINEQKQIRGTLMADIEDLKAWMPRVRSGRIKPVVDTVLPLSEAAQAHALMAENRTKGGVVLLPWSH
ncbi:zinc-binding alcohol dehydrogenase family protein [Metapseudomonas lalkuanensis]|uniref:Zinc-binding alcohol dehydrogenase family protein n=1 Tax=Metapseudomonas lalkuanensis TaxID=2604832 RepID=A0A5J6QNC0_9GAMM|nr:zinc-binding alcohol dehydrogenase family protein [Pseudomonas lalkuanensis]QEY63192.1 zinc-binding alcohol dehydrogenase family protein [Pseudomonas lalkuanensis]